MLNLLLFRHKGYTRVMENRILQDHRRITRREPPMMHMNILIYGTIPVSLYMPLSFFFNTEMKYMTATPSGENTGTLIAWSILQNNHSVHLWVLLLAMCLIFFNQYLLCSENTICKLRKVLVFNGLCVHFFYVAYRIGTYPILTVIIAPL